MISVQHLIERFPSAQRKGETLLLSDHISVKAVSDSIRLKIARETLTIPVADDDEIPIALLALKGHLGRYLGDRLEELLLVKGVNQFTKPVFLNVVVAESRQLGIPIDTVEFVNNYLLTQSKLTKNAGLWIVNSTYTTGFLELDSIKMGFKTHYKENDYHQYRVKYRIHKSKTEELWEVKEYTKMPPFEELQAFTLRSYLLDAILNI